MKKLGFTLAEVLITLVVIGIVAAISLQVIIAGHLQTETVSRLKKALSVANQALQYSTIHNGEVDAWDAPNKVGLAKYMQTYWHPYFSNIKVCNTYQTCFYESNKPFKNPNGSTNNATLVYNNKRTPFLTDDGMLYSFEPSEGYFYMIVDINGPKRPNKLGRDVFLLEFDTEGKSIRPYGYNVSKQDVDSNCSRKQNGFYCASKIVADGWDIKKDYPW